MEYKGIKIELRMLKLTEIDHEHYLKLVDVERLIADIRREIYSGADFEMDQEGKKKYHPTDIEQAILETLAFISNCILRQLVVTCESAEEIKALLRRIHNGYYAGKYCLRQKETGEDGSDEILYFRKYCPGAMRARLEREGKTEEEINEALQESEGDPVFSDDPEQAYLFDNMERAFSHMRYLNHNWNMDLELYEAFLLDKRACKDMLDKLLKDTSEEGPEGDDM